MLSFNHVADKIIAAAHSFGKLFAVLTFALLLSNGVSAQNPPAVNPSSVDSTNDSAKAANPQSGKPTVTKNRMPIVYTTVEVSRYQLPEGGSWMTRTINWLTDDGEIYPDGYVKVKTDTNARNLASLKLDTFRLWINGVCFNKVKPLCFNPVDCTFIFHLSYDTSLSSPWKLFYANPNYWSFHHNVRMSLGTAKTEFRGDEKKTTVLMGTSVTWLVILAYFLLFGLLYLAWKLRLKFLKNPADCIRNGIRIGYGKGEPTNAEDGIININDLQYSLARAQFMWWLIIIFFGFIHIWAITDTTAVPDGSILLLLGITGGTFYISRMIDRSDAQKKEEQIPENETDDDRKKRIKNYIQQFIDKKKKSKGFIMDILNDGAAISLHRLQLVAFTVFLGLHFVWYVLYSLTLPHFEYTMLLLMGISSTAYAGLKTSEPE